MISLLELSRKWSKHINTNIYVARSDLYTIANEIGRENMEDYVNLKLSGDTTTSLNEFAKSRGFIVSWSLVL